MESKETEMDRSTCECGMPILRASDELGCLQCGRPCCPVCAFILESAVYCAACATHLLEGAAVPAPDFVPREPRGIVPARARPREAMVPEVI